MTSWPPSTLPTAFADGDTILAPTDNNQDDVINLLVNHVLSLEAAMAAQETALAALTATQAGEVSFVRKTVDESVTSSTALQDDDHLVLPLLANAIYELNMLLLITGDTAGDFKFQFALPAGAVLLGNADYYSTGIVFVHGFLDNTVISTGTQAGTLPVVVRGLLRVSSTAGNAQFRWAQDASNAAATKVLADSFMRLRRLA